MPLKLRQDAEWVIEVRYRPTAPPKTHSLRWSASRAFFYINPVFLRLAFLVPDLDLSLTEVMNLSGTLVLSCTCVHKVLLDIPRSGSFDHHLMEPSAT
jgi:hypothetical protein